MTSVRCFVSLAALLATAGCAYDGVGGYAPSYPAGYDSGMGSGQYSQPGDLFGGADVASAEVFHAPLAQYGAWVESRFGRAFRPDVGGDWRPYVNGRWGEDRLWISDDPWGWATDHYGRWGHDERIGWVWVPGTVWAPSWVAWREDDSEDVAGWSPIPPGIGYAAGVGFGSAWGYDNWNSWYAPGWVWVPRSSVYRPGFGGNVLPWRTGYNYWRGSRWDHRGGYSGGDKRIGDGRPGRFDGRWPGISEQIGGAITGTPPRARGDYRQWQGRSGGNPVAPGVTGTALDGVRPDGNRGEWGRRGGNFRGNGGSPAGVSGAPVVDGGGTDGVRAGGGRPDRGGRQRPEGVGGTIAEGLGGQAGRERAGVVRAAPVTQAAAPVYREQARVEQPQRVERVERQRGDGRTQRDVRPD